jgi:TnpA family transposase
LATPPSPPAGAAAGAKAPFRSYGHNLFTEWHSRSGGRGVLVHWHVERKSSVVHSQVLSCTASEVAVTVERAVRHGTSMQLGFAITSLLDFDLLPRVNGSNRSSFVGPRQR